MKYLAKFLGAIATYFYKWADALDDEWDTEWVSIRDAVRRRYAEIDAGWGDCHLPSAPKLPLEVDDERRVTDRCMETPPPPLPQAEPRKFWCNGKLESVRPPRCDTPTWWQDKWGKS